MGAIKEAELSALVASWSPVVRAALDELGKQMWSPLERKRGLLRKPEVILRHIVEGPVRRGDEVQWAVSHTRRPSTFDAHGRLTEGRRAYWIVALVAAPEPCFRIEGAGRSDDIPVSVDALRSALDKARAEGPRDNTFYGNKGPLSHK